jgi:hypothetical protein
VDVFNNGGQLTVEEVDQHFAPGFLAEVASASQIVEFVPQVLQLADAPFEVEQAEFSDDGLYVDAVVVGVDGRRLSVEINVADTEPHLIDGILIDQTAVEVPTSLDAASLDDQLAELGPRSALGVYQVTGGQCEAMHEVRADAEIPIASVFKLWVLAALAIEVDDGRATWQETVTVTDQLRSTPTGQIYFLESGDEVSLLDLATAMISISDNTATDMLIDRIGREAVEAALPRLGVRNASSTDPLLSTGNLFALTFVAAPPTAQDYRQLDESGRRLILEELDRQVLPWAESGATMDQVTESLNVDGRALDQPRDLDIGWAATVRDLCQTLVALDELAQVSGLEPVSDVLEISAGPGLSFDRERWPTIRFKGGSLPGLVAGAWWFEGSDGDRFVVAGGVANPDAPVDTNAGLLALAAGIGLVD